MITAVTPRAFSQSNSRRSSARRAAVSEKALNRVSIVSITTRWAPTSSMAAPRRRNSPSRSLTGLLDLGGVDADVVEHQHPVCLQLREIKAQRGDIGGKIVSRFLKGHEHPGLTELGDPPDEELDREQRLAATGGTTDERRPSPWEAPACQFVQADDPGRGLGQPAESFAGDCPFVHAGRLHHGSFLSRGVEPVTEA